MSKNIFQDIFEEVQKGAASLQKLGINLFERTTKPEKQEPDKTKGKSKNEPPQTFLERAVNQARGRYDPLRELNERFNKFVDKSLSRWAMVLGISEKKLGTDGANAVSKTTAQPKSLFPESRFGQAILEKVVVQQAVFQQSMFARGQATAPVKFGGVPAQVPTRLGLPGSGRSAGLSALVPNKQIAKQIAKQVAKPTVTALKVATQATASGGGASALSGIGPALAAVGAFGGELLAAIPVVGEIAAVAAVVVGGLGLLGAAVVKWTDALIEGQKQFAKFNTGLALAYAQANQRTLMRDIKYANATAGGTSALINSRENLKDAWLPFSTALTNLQTATLQPLNDTIADILRSLKPLADEIENLANWIRSWVETEEDKKRREANAKSNAPRDFFESLAKGILPREPWAAKLERKPIPQVR